MVDVAKHEDGEEGGNGAGFIGASTFGSEMDLILELAEDVRLESEGDADLADGREHESPGPARVGNVHPRRASYDGWKGGGEAFAVVIPPRLGIEGLRLVWRWIRRGGIGRLVVVEGLAS